MCRFSPCKTIFWSVDRFLFSDRQCLDQPLRASHDPSRTYLGMQFGFGTAVHWVAKPVERSSTLRRRFMHLCELLDAILIDVAVRVTVVCCRWSGS